MKHKYPLLCSPITLGNVNFRNRMFAAPMGATDITPDCSVGPRTPGFYELRAKGGAAAVTASELVVHPETDASHMLHMDLTVPGNLAGWTFLADAIARHGAVPSVELSHSGQYAGTYLLDKNKKKGLTQYGPSDWVRPDGIPVKAMTKEMIAEIVKAYGEAAALCKRAGFQMLMVHAGHGWLLNQFLSPAFNHRDDEYGSDTIENRVRFTREALQSVRDAVGPGFPIEVRLSGTEVFDEGYSDQDNVKGGYGIEDGIKIAQAVEDLVDMIHVSAGSYQFGFFRTTIPMFYPHGVNVKLAAEIKKHVNKPVACIGGLNDPEQMEEILESGKADVIYLARALLADPYLPNKIMANNDDEIVRCLRCYTCMAERPTTGTRKCAVNPQIGREVEGLNIPLAAEAKNVVVVGGGIGGMEAALIAAKRGHKVTLIEKTDQLGGILKSEQALPFKYEMYDLSKSLAKQLEKTDVDIKLNTTATPELIESLNPDELILAVGSNPIIPNIPGIDKDNVVIVNDYYLNKDKVGDKVVVLGGGLAGCECAIHLSDEGKEVHLVELRDDLAVDCNIRNKPKLMEMVKAHTNIHTHNTGKEITDEGLIVVDENGNDVLIPADTIICAVGQRPNRDTVMELRECAPHVREIGDCVKASNISHAMYGGYHAALDI